MYTLKVEAPFEAAHRIVDYPGKCDRLHGHNWVVEMTIAGTELDELGMLVDFKAAKKALRDAVDAYDHRFLNELAPYSAGMNPTAENLARVLYEKLEGADIYRADAHLTSVTVFESPKTSITYEKD